MIPLKTTVTCQECGEEHYFLEDFADKRLYSSTTALVCGCCNKECWWGKLFSLTETKRGQNFGDYSFGKGLDVLFTSFDSELSFN